MNGLIISWGIAILIVVGILGDRLWTGARDVITQLAIATKQLFNGPTVTIPKYFRAYFHTGRHRRDNPPRDSEVDRWPGADEEFVDTLRGMNAVM